MNKTVVDTSDAVGTGLACRAAYNAGLRMIADAVKQQLDERCLNGNKAPRNVICSALGLSDDHDVVISLLLKEKDADQIEYLPGYKSWPGKFGGIGKEDGVRPPKVKGTRVVNLANIDAAFVKRLGETLESSLPEKNGPKGVNRAAIAQALGEPGSKMENEISKVFATSLFDGRFYAKKGPQGGILRGVNPKKETAPMAVVETATTEPAMASSPQETSTPEASPAEALTDSSPIMTMESADAPADESAIVAETPKKTSKKHASKSASKKSNKKHEARA